MASSLGEYSNLRVLFDPFFPLQTLPSFNYRFNVNCLEEIIVDFAGLFLNEDDLDEANRLSKKISYCQLAENEKNMVTNILEFNWDSEIQMVSNLLHFPHIMPDDKRLKWLLKGLKEQKHPYYVLAAATGVAGLKLQGQDAEEIVELLKDLSTSQPGVVALRAFMSLVEHLTHPKDTQFVLKFMHKSKSNLRYNSLDWLIENIKDTNELLSLLEDQEIPEDVKLEAIDRVNTPESEVQGKVQLSFFATVKTTTSLSSAVSSKNRPFVRRIRLSKYL